MYAIKRISIILACVLLSASSTAAQSLHQETTQARVNSQSVTIIIENQRLRFAASALTQEFRLEVFNQAGESVYDSGLVTGAELFWNLHNGSGEAVPSGLYAYTLTIKEAGSETPATRRGHLIVERGRDREPQTDRLWVTSQSSVGAEAAISGGELTVSSGPETNVVGTRIGGASAARAQLNLDFFGTPGRIPMFLGGDLLADSAIWQDFNGRIGIGTHIPGTALLTVAGQIETTAGGIKFPNGTVQTSAGLSQVIRNTSLTGNGKENSPLGVAVPLALNGSNSSPILEITNGAGIGIRAAGGTVGIGLGSDGVIGFGGSVAGIAFSRGGAGVRAFGGNSSSLGGNGGSGVVAAGGNSDGLSRAGDGLIGIGGGSNGGFAGNGVTGVGGNTDSGTGAIGIIGHGGTGPDGSGLAGAFNGNVVIHGTLSKSAGSFRIDHPLDPANKYLTHSFVESPDMKNIYDGIVRLDADGSAIVELPEWFEALNKDFRYLLTPVGAPMPGLYIAEKVSGNRFKIAGGQPGLEASWQVTGIRQDAYANKYRIQVEEAKPERERGHYLRPEVFSQPEEKSVEWARNPELMRQIKSRRQDAEMRRQGRENDR